MKVWVDLANSPHVLFFAPLIREIERRGVPTIITCRDFAQTVPLARLHGLEVVVVGRHGGATVLGKGWAIASRAMSLRGLGRRARASVAVSHNSYSHCLAAKSLGIPYVTIMDYEHTPANHVNFRLADRILLPSSLSLQAVRKYGATPERVVFYDGFKEQVYLDADRGSVAGDGALLPDVDWVRDVVAVVRPPADFALYHRFRNPLFEQWLESVGNNPKVKVILLPRTPDQRARAVALRLPSVVAPASAVPGIELISRSDLVVSAGGTMNREAAILGVPAYSLFAGRTAEVDRALERLGRLVFIRTEADFAKIRLEKKTNGEPLRNPGLRTRLVDSILAAW